MAEQGEYGGPSFGGQSYGGGYDPTKSWAENQRQKQEDENLGGWLTGYNPLENDLVQDPFAAAIREKQKQRAIRSGMLGLESKPQRNMPNAWDSLGWDVPMLAGTVETPLQEIGFKQGLNNAWNTYGFGMTPNQELFAALSKDDKQAYTTKGGDAPAGSTAWGVGYPGFASFNTNVNPTGGYDDPALSPEARQLDPGAANKALDSWVDGLISTVTPSTQPTKSPASPTSPFGMFLSIPPQRTGPVIEAIGPTKNVTPTVSPFGGALLDIFGIEQDYETPQEDIDALMNDVLGLQMDQDVLGLDEAMVSNYAGNPWGQGSVISDIAHNASISDSPGEYAESALYNQLAQQLAPVEPLNPPDRARPVVRPAGTQAANAPAPVRHDPIANLVRTVLSPKINQIKPETVKAIKKGRKPDYTMMSNYQQDLVRELLNPQDSSSRKSKPAYARMDDK